MFEIKASVALSDIIKSIEEHIDSCRGDEFSLWEANKLRAMAAKIEQKVAEELKKHGLSLD